MQNLKHLLLLRDATLLHYIRPQDLLELSLSCKNLQSLIQSNAYRAAIKQLYFSYYGPVLTMIRIPEHSYLGFQSADDLRYLLTSELRESQNLVLWLKEDADCDSSQSSKLYKDTVQLLVSYLGDRMNLEIARDSTYEEEVRDDILCNCDDVYANAVDDFYRLACHKKIKSVTQPRWKVLDYGNFNRVLCNFCHFFLFSRHWEAYNVNELGAKLEQFFQFRMPPSAIKEFLFQISSGVGLEDDEYFGTGLKYLASLKYDYEPFVGDTMLQKVKNVLKVDDGALREYSKDRVYKSAYSRLLFFGYYGYETEYRDIDNVSDTDIQEHDSSPRFCLRYPVEQHLSKNCYDQLTHSLSSYARKHPINGERAAVILAILGHCNKLSDPDNVYMTLMREAIEKSDDADFALLLYKLIRYCKWTKYKLEDHFIYVMFGQKTDYQKKVYSMVKQHIISGAYWDLIEVTIKLCGPLEQQDALSLLQIIYKSLSNTRSFLWTDVMEQDFSYDIEGAQQNLEQNLQKYCNLLGGADTLRLLLINLDHKRLQDFSMEYLAQSVKFCEPQQTEQQADLSSVVAQQFKDHPRQIAQLLKCFKSNNVRHDKAWEKVQAICTEEQMAQVCQAVGPELCRKLGIDNSQKDPLLRRLHELVDTIFDNASTTYNKLLECSNQNLIWNTYAGNFQSRRSEVIDELICKVIEGTIKAFGADAALFMSVFQDEIFMKSSPILSYYSIIVLNKHYEQDALLQAEFTALMSSCKAYVQSKSLEIRPKLLEMLVGSFNGAVDLMRGKFIPKKMADQVVKLLSDARTLELELKNDPLYQEMIQKQLKRRRELEDEYFCPYGSHYSEADYYDYL
ncbi:hypothetical protein MIR68_003663 [Amoeboaphelidium protococcarum]|nr:hypothetical protein MIR68_003663 [Amoeboaphelidium protococcarum]